MKYELPARLKAPRWLEKKDVTFIKGKKYTLRTRRGNFLSKTRIRLSKTGILPLSSLDKIPTLRKNIKAFLPKNIPKLLDSHV